MWSTAERNQDRHIPCHLKLWEIISKCKRGSLRQSRNNNKANDNTERQYKSPWTSMMDDTVRIYKGTLINSQSPKKTFIYAISFHISALLIMSSIKHDMLNSKTRCLKPTIGCCNICFTFPLHASLGSPSPSRSAVAAPVSCFILSGFSQRSVGFCYCVYFTAD